MQLYKINEQLRFLANQLEQYADENGGEVLPLFETELQNLTMARDDKIQNIYYLLKEWKREADAISEEKKFLEARRKAVENRIERLKAYLAQNLEVGEKWKGRIGSIYWQTSESVEATDLESVPDIYIKKELTNKRELLLDIKNGADIQGVEIKKSMNLVVR